MGKPKLVTGVAILNINILQIPSAFTYLNLNVKQVCVSPLHG